MADIDWVAVTRWLSSSEFLWTAVTLAGVFIILKLASKLLEGGLAETVRQAFTTNWQLTVLASSAFLLSVAAGSRTWDGMSQFTGEPILSLLITFGIQGVMLIIAWLIGESFAAGLAAGRAKAAHGVVRRMSGGVAGLVVGGLMFGAAALLIALYLGLLDPSRPIWGFAAQDKFVQQVAFVALAVMLIGPLFMARSGGIIGDYANGLRIVLGNAILWVMFFACAGTSVFFSYISLFDSIFPASERVRAAEIRAINQVSGIVSDIGETATRRRMAEAEALFQSEAWAAYERELDKAVRLASIAPEKIREEMVRALREQESRIARLEEQRANASGGQAGLAQRKTSLNEEVTRLAAERPEVAVAVQEQKSIVSAAERRLDEQRAKVLAEEKGVEGSGKAGKGQFWRAAREEEGKIQAELQVARERLKGHETRLAGIDRRIGTARAEIAQIDGDLAKLVGEAETAQRMIAVAKTAGTGDRHEMTDPSATAAALERERQSFRQKPEQVTLANLQSLCTTMQGVSMKVAALRNDAAAIDCDPKQATEAAAPVFALNVGLAAFAQHCAGGEQLPQAGGTDGLLAFGRKCLQDSGLVSRDAAPLAARFSALDLSRDDKAHKFVVSANAFTDGNRLAYLALAIAIGMDSLILMAALFGASAVRSPLTDLDGVNDLTPEQLEAAIDATLMQTAEPARTLSALLQAQRPIQGIHGYTAEIWIDDHDPLADDMRAVLTAGASIGAVRPFGDGRTQFQIKTGLSRYIAIAQKKKWPKKSEEAARRDLLKVIGVALMPDTKENAEAVIEELHPISDQDGFAAEVNVDALSDPSRLRLVRGVIGAGATVPGAVRRNKADNGKYAVSSDFYKTLLLIRAGEYGGHRGPPPAAIHDGRRAFAGGALHEARPQLANDDRLPKSLTHRISDQARSSYPPRSVVVREHIDTLLARLNLDASADDVFWLLTEDDNRPRNAGDALEELMKGRTILGSRMRELERASRVQLESETARLAREAAGARSVTDGLVQEAADKIYQALPMLLLMPGGLSERVLRQCLDALDDAGASDNGHRDIDHLMQRQMRALESFLKQQDRDTYQSWAAVGEYLASYDEQRPTLTVVGTGA
ncbi:MAG TPA: hypothetical protein VNZ50_15425 [Hyphomicrobiaceae bacterium]|nr:hypothetical protein [Hyphomicrobiaceae bacterium]